MIDFIATFLMGAMCGFGGFLLMLLFAYASHDKDGDD